MKITLRALVCYRVNNIKIDSSVEPVVHPPRRVPIALREKIKAELDRMEDIGVIFKQNQPTPWVNRSEAEW